MTQQRSDRPIVRADCPKCGPDRLAQVSGHVQRRWDDPKAPVWATVDYRLLQCRGCEEVFLQIDEIFSEDTEMVENSSGGWDEQYQRDIKYWPTISKRKRPPWLEEITSIDGQLGGLVNDIYLALDNDLAVLSAIGMRTAIDRATELLDIDPLDTFAKKLDRLLAIGRIGQTDRETLSTLIDAASAAAHRGWRPTNEQLQTMVSIMEGFLHQSFILDRATEVLKGTVPARQRRRKGIAISQSTR